MVFNLETSYLRLHTFWQCAEFLEVFVYAVLLVSCHHLIHAPMLPAGFEADPHRHGVLVYVRTAAA